jgi:hypothetical protein
VPITGRLAGLRRRIGRRGSSLLFLALLDVVYGTGLAFITDIGRVAASYQFMAQVAPLEVWASVWYLVGAVCLVQAFMLRDQVAFGCAVALKTTWGGITLLGWAVHGVPRGYVSAAIWLAFAGWVFIISGWSENDRNGARR